MWIYVLLLKNWNTCNLSLLSSLSCTVRGERDGVFLLGAGDFFGLSHSFVRLFLLGSLHNFSVLPPSPRYCIYIACTPTAEPHVWIAVDWKVAGWYSRLEKIQRRLSSVGYSIHNSNHMRVPSCEEDARVELRTNQGYSRLKQRTVIVKGVWDLCCMIPLGCTPPEYFWPDRPVAPLTTRPDPSPQSMLTTTCRIVENFLRKWNRLLGILNRYRIR